jgi:hypothetical protein
MENERRSYPRKEADMRLSLVFDNREVMVDVRNLSGGGAFVQVTREDFQKVKSADVGRVVKFHMKGASALASSRATIIRCVEQDDEKFVALAFNTSMP